MAVGPTTSSVEKIRLAGTEFAVPTDPLVQHVQLIQALRTLGVTIMDPQPTTSPVQTVELAGVKHKVPTDRNVRHQQLLGAIEGLGAAGVGGGGGLLSNEVANVGLVVNQGDYFRDDVLGTYHVMDGGTVREISFSE